MRVAGRLAAEVLDYLTPHIKPGITTGGASTARARLHGQRARHVPGNAQLRAARACALPGVAVHVGQPRRLPRHPRRAQAQGRRHHQRRRHGDQGRLPRRHQPHVLRRRAVDPGEAARRSRPTRRCGGASARSSRARISATSAHTIQEHAEAHGFSVVREFCGHGIGRQFHEEPQVLHYGRPGTGLKLQPGMIFTIEPMINAGRAGHPRARRRLDDRDRRPFAFRAVGAHGAGHARRLRGADAFRRLAAAAAA